MRLPGILIVPDWERSKVKVALALTAFGGIIVYFYMTGMPWLTKGMLVNGVAIVAIILGGARAGLILSYIWAISIASRSLFGISLPNAGDIFLSGLGPWAGLGMYAAGTIILCKGSLNRVAQGINECWGLRYLVAYVISGLLLAPTVYSDPVAHLSWSLVQTVAVMCITVVVALPKNRVFEITKMLLVLAFGISFFAYFFIAFISKSDISILILSIGGQKYLRIDSFFGAANDSVGFFITLLPFGLMYLERRKVPKWIPGGVLLFSVYFVYRSYTRMAWIALPIVLMTYLLCLGRRRYALTLFIVALAGTLVLPVFGTFFHEIEETGGLAISAQNSLAERWHGLWLPLIRGTMQDETITILFGTGDASIYIYPLTPINISDGRPIPAHSLWVDRFVSRGLLGVGLWLLFTMAVIIRAVQAMLKRKPEERKWLAAGIASWIGYIIYGLTANAQVDWSVLTSILAGVCMWSWAGMIESENVTILDELDKCK